MFFSPISYGFLDDGISIPQSYTSFIAPLSSSKIYNEIVAMNSRDSFETPFVVKFLNSFEICPSKPCFEFRHPRADPEGK